MKVLPRQPGTKESRYMHLLAGDESPNADERWPACFSTAARKVTESIGRVGRERIAQLEVEVDELRREIETLRQQFAAFQKQFQ